MNSIIDRKDAFINWLAVQLKAKDVHLLPMTGDASFRYYYRLKDFNGMIAVDSAPELANDNHGFVTVAQLLENSHLHAPKVFAHDLDRGFLLISDLGDTLYLSALNDNTADELYGSALDSLAQMQTIKDLDAFALFGAEHMRLELENFRSWFIEKYLNCQLDTVWQQKLTHIFDVLIQSAIQQPQVFIHRDYHSRNLLVGSTQPGILDFQDAMIGPVTYDAVSLLRDAYIAWPDEKVSQWALLFYQRIEDRHDLSPDHFMQAFDYMGVQRHLKAIFIFARKYLRDDVDTYLADIPRTLNYVRNISAKYPALKDLHALITERLSPELQAKGIVL
ncbi:MAG: phosphotransferase [Gammaproteobacteria bacterium]|jgi:aminoglycoside/choline kinase family phosphotransferase